MRLVKKCIDCNGKVKNTRGQRCLTCNGKGEYADEDLISDLNAIGFEQDELDEDYPLEGIPEEEEIEEL